MFLNLCGLNNKCEKWKSVINDYQHNLVSTECIDNRLEKLRNLFSQDPILMVNFKNFSQHPTIKGSVPTPKVLRGINDILNFQKSAYKNKKWTKLEFNIIQHHIGEKEGYVVVTGTHIVYDKQNLNNPPIYVQALEMFGLVLENCHWKIGAVSFIDFVWTEPPKSKQIKV